MKHNPLALARAQRRQEEGSGGSSSDAAGAGGNGSSGAAGNASSLSSSSSSSLKGEKALRAEIRRLEARLASVELSRDKLQMAIGEQLLRQFTTLRALFGFQLEFEDERGGKNTLVRLRPDARRDLVVVMRALPEGHIGELLELSEELQIDEITAFLAAEDIPSFLRAIQGYCAENPSPPA